ncbi:MAG: choice-of-anchor Q domain-containing protein [Lysobacterales bacterium]
MARNRVIPAVLATGLASLVGAWPATAAIITVNTLDDELNTDGDCSLREAAEAANTNTAVDACLAGSAGLDTIALPAGTIPLSVTIDVTDAVTVSGAGRTSTTIQQGSASTAFNGPGAAGAAMTFADFTLVGDLNADGPQAITVTRVDLDGDGVNSLDGSITISDTTFVGVGGVNSLGGNITIAGATFGTGGVNSSSGTVSLTDVTIGDGVGGGDGVNTSNGNITLTRVAIFGDNGVSSDDGNVVMVDSSVTVANPDGVNTGAGSISLTRSLVGGAVEDGVRSSSGTITLVNSTVTGGSEVESAAVGGDTTITLDASTVAGFIGIGIDADNPSAATLINSIVADNGQDCSGAVGSATSSLDSDGSCGLTGPGNFSNIDPQLLPLADNGGPTRTLLPQPGSPVIDAGSNALCQAVDQRGVARPVDGNGDGNADCDIGAVEAGGGVDAIFYSGFD